MNTLEEKINNHKKMQNILTANKTPLSEKISLMTTYGIPTIYYASMVFNSDLSSKHCEEKFDSLYWKMIKATFGFAKNAGTLEIARQLNIPTAV